SWDRTAIPKPFARVDFVYGEPLAIPKMLTGDDTEYYRLLLEKRLNDIYTMAWNIHDKSGH
ncbi:MAG: lysophospholipid acyltransferase family protein, partial [Desulforhopalus sp.]